MIVRPFKNLARHLPRFSKLVTRAQFALAASALSKTGRVRVRGAQWQRRDDDLHTHLPAPWADRTPFQLFRTGDGQVKIHPGFVRVPGRPEGFFPWVNGVSILSSEAVIAGKGFVCLRLVLRQASRLMEYHIYDEGDIVDTFTATVHLMAENTVELAADPDIIITANDRGTAAAPVSDSTDCTYGTYLIPLGHVGARVSQFISHNLQVTLTGGFLRLTRLGT